MILLSLLALLSAAATPTNEPDYRAALQACIAASDETSAAYAQCYGDAIDAAHKILDNRNDKLLAKFEEDDGVTAAFVAEMGAWQDYREHACSFYWQTPYFGSMPRSIVGPNCVLNVVEARIKVLDDMLSQFEVEE